MSSDDFGSFLTYLTTQIRLNQMETDLPNPIFDVRYQKLYIAYSVFNLKQGITSSKFYFQIFKSQSTLFM